MHDHAREAKKDRLAHKALRARSQWLASADNQGTSFRRDEGARRHPSGQVSRQARKDGA